MTIDLTQYGWERFFADAKKRSSHSNLEHGRVISVHKSRYEVITEIGLFSCEILGNLQFKKDPLLQPAVGDWVLLDRYKDTRIIVEILDRKSLLKRQKKHDRFPKPIAANIDRAIIVQSIGPDFNIKRIERILVHIYEAGIQPVIIINKIDLATPDVIQDIKQDLYNLNHDIDVMFTSYKTGEGIGNIQQSLKPGETIIFIGSSGVGKSSLINMMLGTHVQETQHITESTGKGKHTTTARRLFKLDNGTLVIDTPGTREFGMHEDDSGVKESFEIIEYLATQCRFSNCSHDNEPDCAIRTAIENGALDHDTYERYQKLVHESSQTPKAIRQSSKQSSLKRLSEPLRSIRRGKTKKKK